MKSSIISILAATALALLLVAPTTAQISVTRRYGVRGLNKVVKGQDAAADIVYGRDLEEMSISMSSSYDFADGFMDVMTAKAIKCSFSKSHHGKGSSSDGSSKSDKSSSKGSGNGSSKGGSKGGSKEDSEHMKDSGNGSSDGSSKSGKSSSKGGSKGSGKASSPKEGSDDMKRGKGVGDAKAEKGFDGKAEKGFNGKATVGDAKAEKETPCEGKGSKAAKLFKETSGSAKAEKGTEAKAGKEEPSEPSAKGQ